MGLPYGLLLDNGGGNCRVPYGYMFMQTADIRPETVARLAL